MQRWNHSHGPVLFCCCCSPCHCKANKLRVGRKRILCVPQWTQGVQRIWSLLCNQWVPPQPPPFQKLVPNLRLSLLLLFKGTLGPGVHTVITTKLPGCESWRDGLAAVGFSSWRAGRTPDVEPGHSGHPAGQKYHHSQAHKQKWVLYGKQGKVCCWQWVCFSLL